jgi:hypothetical protein
VLDENNLPTRKEIFTNSYILSCEEVVHHGKDWFVIKLGSGIDIHIPDEGMVFVHNLQN